MIMATTSPEQCPDESQKTHFKNMLSYVTELRCKAPLWQWRVPRNFAWVLAPKALARYRTLCLSTHGQHCFGLVVRVVTRTWALVLRLKVPLEACTSSALRPLLAESFLCLHTKQRMMSMPPPAPVKLPLQHQIWGWYGSAAGALGLSSVHWSVAPSLWCQWHWK